MTNHGSFGLNEAFDPDTVRILASAFEGALQSLNAFDAEHLEPYSTRQLLAKGIIDMALAGERDIARLREGALARLRGSQSNWVTAQSGYSAQREKIEREER
jgi:hypothetical protein